MSNPVELGQRQQNFKTRVPPDARFASGSVFTELRAEGFQTLDLIGMLRRQSVESRTKWVVEAKCRVALHKKLHREITTVGTFCAKLCRVKEVLGEERNERAGQTAHVRENEHRAVPAER